ncbi:MAG: divalent-cation tolerance protein CutA [Candidatus Hecatellaceae archaeon]
MSVEMIVVLTMAPDENSAERISRELVESRLAACCSLVKGLTSTYWWEGKVEEAEEVLLIIKTSRVLYREVERKIRDFHPYKVPEIVAFKVEAGLPEYLSWLREALRE